MATGDLGWTLLGIGIAACVFSLLGWLVWSSLPKTLVRLRMAPVEAFRLISRKLVPGPWKVRLDGKRLRVDVQRDTFVAIQVAVRGRADGWCDVRFSVATTGSTFALSLFGQGIAGMVAEAQGREFAKKEVLPAILAGLPPGAVGLPY